jgi:uncharacterized protein YdeI (YjbR/CyaY-like superfamily)
VVTVDPRRLLRASTRKQWRAWLKKNHAKATEVWLVYAKRHTGKPRVSYDEAVEEALCFGWIDGIGKRLDEDYYIQRFSPRKDLKNWSEVNLARFQRMVAEGRMTDAGRAKRPADVAPPPRRFQSGDPVPAFVAKALAKEPAARRNFEAMAPGYRRNYLRWITEAKKEETRAQRLKKAIRMLAANVKPVIGS